MPTGTRARPQPQGTTSLREAVRTPLNKRYRTGKFREGRAAREPTGMMAILTFGSASLAPAKSSREGTNASSFPPSLILSLLHLTAPHKAQTALGASSDLNEIFVDFDRHILLFFPPAGALLGVQFLNGLPCCSTHVKYLRLNHLSRLSTVPSWI